MTSPESARDQGNADRTLAETEQRYRVIAENAGDVVFETGSDAVIRWVSPSIEPRLGWQPAELAGRAAPTLVHPDDVASVIAGAELVRSGAHQAAGRSRVLGADGSYRWFAWVQRAVVTVSDAEISLVTSMRLFPHASLLTWEGFGHVSGTRGNACINDAVAAYLTTGSLPGSANVSCAS